MISEQEILNASILIVDDQQSNVHLLEDMLREADYRCITLTEDPYEVCALHKKDRYDLILLDLQMPGMNGYQVMDDLKKIETDGYLPVLAITAQPDHKLHKDFLATLMSILKDTGLAPRYLELELTENVLMHDTDAIASVLKALKAMGRAACY